MVAREKVNTRRHELKCWPVFFEAIRIGKKRFEVRNGTFDEGDELFLREYDPDTVGGYYTGRQMICDVTFVQTGRPFLPDGLSVLSIQMWIFGNDVIDEIRGKRKGYNYEK